MLADTSRSLIPLPGMFAVLLSLLEPAPGRKRSRQAQVLGSQGTSPRRGSDSMSRLHLAETPNIVRTGTPCSSRQSSKNPATQIGFSSEDCPHCFALSFECYPPGECYYSA
jgi:hypothetical protein